MEACKRCGRKLKTPKSIEVGYGATCKQKHDVEEAEFLKRQITIYDELAYQEMVGQC